jgi:hypothetical protein
VDGKSPGPKTVTVRVNPGIKDVARTHTISGLQVSKLYNAWLLIVQCSHCINEMEDRIIRNDPRHALPNTVLTQEAASLVYFDRGTVAMWD